MPETSDLILKPSMGTPSLMQPRHKDDTFRQRILCTFRDRRKGRKTMFINGAEKRKMERQQQEEKEVCLREKTSEEATEIITGSLKDIYKSNKKYAENNVSLSAVDENRGDSRYDPYRMIDDLPDDIPQNIDESLWFSKFKCAELRECLQQMDPLELRITELIGIDGITQTEAAEILGLTQGRVSQIWKNVKSKMESCLPGAVRRRYRD